MSILDPLPADLRAEVAAEGENAELMQLAALDPLAYDRQRQAAAEELGCRLSTLDAMVRALRCGPEGCSGDGAAVSFEAPEPWPEPVDGAALLQELVATFGRFLALPPRTADALALWTMHAHCHQAADVSPIQALTSPEKRCGKTRTLTLLGRLVPKPLPTANITAAALFRSIEKWRPTLLIDEGDSFLRDNEDLRGVLNSGHTQATAYVIRTVGEDHEPRRFGTWAPKAIALIGSLPATLADRSIDIRMQRKRPGDRVERFRDRRHGPALDVLCRKAARWAADHLAVLADADPDLPEALNDRAQDNWRALIAIADEAGQEWPGLARAAALALSGTEAVEDHSRGTMLLADIHAVFVDRGVERLSSTELARALGAMEHRPWADWKGKAITQAALARLLKPFGIEPKGVRIGEATPKGYDRAWFSDAWARYLPHLEAQQPSMAVSPPWQSATPQQAPIVRGLVENRGATPVPHVAPSEAEKRNDSKVVADVALSEPGVQGKEGSAGTVVVNNEGSALWNCDL